MGASRGVIRLSTRQEAIEYAHYLLRADRMWPVVAVSTAADGTERIDAERIADELAGMVEVVVVPTGDLTREVERILPPKTNAYGGAGRVYPVGSEWHADPYVARLRFCYSDEEGPHITEMLLRDARGHIRAQQFRSESKEPVKATGTVTMVISPDRALVRVDDDGTAVLGTDGTFPGYEVTQLLQPGMRVSGTLTQDGRALLADLKRLSPAEALPLIKPGDVVPAKVTSTDAKTAVVSVFPGVNTRTDRPGKVRVDDVVAVRVEATGKSDGQGWVLHIVEDPNPETMADAPPLIAGGPAWLTLPDPGTPSDREDTAAPTPATARAPLPGPRRPVRPEPEEAEAGDPESPVKPVPGPVGDAPLRLELDRALRELAEANRDRTELRDERGRLYAELDEIAEENARLRVDLERARAARKPAPSKVRQFPTAPTPDDSDLFLDPEEQLRFEVYLAWARRIPAGEKAQRPLADFDVADTFLPSLEETQGVDRSKVIDVIVEVLTGLADTMPGRELHRLRSGPAGSPPITHPELGTAWRASIQVKTASARRLHFWRGSDGHVTLAQIGVHDDMDISA